MKKVKTLIAIFLCMFATALFGACSCSEPDVSVVSIKVAGVSSNLYLDTENEKYLVKQGDSFSISFELLPATATNKTVYVNLTPANKISCDTPIINNPVANEETGYYDVMFTATANSGDTIIEFETNDGNKKASVRVEVVTNLSLFSTPANLAYNEITEKLTWDKSVAETANGMMDATAYEIIVNEKDVYVSDTNSLTLPMNSGEDYFVKIKAVGKLADRTGDSAYSADCNFHVASTPTNFKTINEKGHLYWEYNEPTRISEFILDFGVGRVSIPSDTKTSYTFDFANYVFTNGFEQDNFTLKLSAVNTAYTNGAPEEELGITTHIKNSRGNPQISLTKLKAPTNLRVNTTKAVGSIFSRSVLTWDNVNKAEYYDVEIFKRGSNTPISKDNRKVGNSIDLTSLIDSIGEYTITIVPKGDSASTFSNEAYIKTSYDFVVIPLLSGSVNYTSDMLTLDTAGLIDTLGISTGELNKLDYELYYSTNGVGQYDNVINMTAAQEINLSQITNETDSEFNILVRPVGTARYTSKNIVMSQVKNIEENKTVSGWITQLKTVEIVNVDKNGVINAIDTNTDKRLASKYKFLLFDGHSTIQQTLYRENLVFDAQDNTKFSTSIVDLFQIKNPQNYSVKIIPVSTTALDANISETTSFEFTQLGKVDVASIVISNNEIRWNNVDNYYSYDISINGAEATNVTTNKYLVEDVATLTDNNSITISAIGNDINTINGGTVVVSKGRAQKVNNIRIEDGNLTWDNDIANSTFYVYISYPVGEPHEVRCDSNVFTGLDKITADVTVNIIRSVPTAFNSIESENYNLVRLTTPTADLELVNNTYSAKFTAVENCDNYKITIYRSTTLVKTENISILGSTPTATLSEGKINFTLPTLEAGDYAVYIQSLPSDQSSTDYQTNNKYYLISEESQSSELIVYPQVVISGKTHILNWSFGTDNGLKDFVIDFADGGVEDVVTANKFYDFASLEGGTYVLSIYATSTKTNVVYAEPVNVTITKAGVTTLDFEDGRIFFTAVPNAKEYKVYNHNDELLRENRDYVLETGVDDIIYIRPKNASVDMVSSIYIVAIGNDDIIDGNASQSISYKQISATQNVLFSTSGNSKIFTWEAVENNDGYQVVIKNSSDAILATAVVNTNSYTIPDKFIIGANLFEEGTYTFEIMVIGGADNGVHLINSNICTQNFTKLAGISNMTKSYNTISWEYNGDAIPVSYLVNILTMDAEYNWNIVYTTSITNIVGTTTTFDLTDINYTGYKIEIACIGSDETFTISSASTLFTYNYGAEGQTSIFVKANAPALVYNAGSITFNNIADAESYEFYHFDGTDYVPLTEDVEYELIYDDVNEIYTLNLLDAAEVYNIAIKTIANPETGKLNSDYSTPVKVSKLTRITDLAINNLGIISWTLVDDAKGYQLFNITKDTSYIFDGETNNVSYESLSLVLGDICEFCIMPLGEYNADSEINYLNGDLSNTISLSAINNVAEGSLEIEDGVISWDPVEGAESYSVEIYQKTGEGSYGPLLKSIVVTNATMVDVTYVSQILPTFQTVVARIKPISTLDNQYVILDTLTFVEIPFTRYNVIKNVTIEDGLIKFTIDISGVDFNDMVTFLTTTDYTTLDEAYVHKYYGYYNFKIDILGATPLHITLQNMTRYAYDLFAFELYAYYELSYLVNTTKELTIKISSMGNYGVVNSEYNAIASLPNETNGTSFKAYKYVAPRPTASENLVASDGTIIFRKIHMADDSTFARKYVLTAREGSSKMYYIFEIPESDQSESYTIQDIFSVNFLLSVNNGDPQQVRLEYNREYLFNITSLGTETVVSGETLYLRSNPYKETAVTFLKDESALSYMYTNGDVNGGHLSWQSNEKCINYNLYVLKETDANYGGDTEYIKANSLWINNPSVRIIEVERSKNEFAFDEAMLDDGAYYWCAIRPMGNDDNFISAPTASNTVVVYKLKPVINQTLKDGTFTWVSSELSTANIAGYMVIIKVYVEGQTDPVKTIRRAQLIPNNTLEYTLETEVIDVSGVVHQLLGETEGGLKEYYGIEVYAVGNRHNGIQSVASSRKAIDNMNTGYARLDAMSIAVNMDEAKRCVEWTVDDALVYSIKSYNVLNGATIISNTTSQSVAFDSLTAAGDYSIEVVALASGSQYLNSIPSNMVKLIKFHPPEFVVQNGVLTWQSDLNGATLVPHESLVQIFKNGAQVGDDIVTENTTISLDNSYPAGEYTVRVKFKDYEEEGVYSIASSTRDVVVNKLDMPTIETVDNYTNAEDKECEQFASALKWDYVVGKNGEKITHYIVQFAVFNGADYVVKQTLEFKDANYDINRFYEDAVNECIYLNITTLTADLGLAGGVGRVNIMVFAIGNDVNKGTIQSGTYLAYLSGDSGLLSLNYSIGNPVDAGSDFVNGILRWSGADDVSQSDSITTPDPVLITLTYKNPAGNGTLTEEIYLPVSHINTYGKIYYLPYMVEYSSVLIQFVLGGGVATSNPLQLAFDKQELFNSGDGTELNPYVITDPSQFKNIQYRPLSYVRIDETVSEISVSNWTMIENFGGKIVGYKKQSGEMPLVNIYGIAPIQTASMVYSALFKNITSDGYVKNIKFNFENVQVYNYTNGSGYNQSIEMASVAINNYGGMKNVEIFGTMTGYSKRSISFGGAVVYNYSVLDGVKTAFSPIIIKSESSISGDGLFAGGIAYANTAIIKNCVSSSKINVNEFSNTRHTRKAAGITFNNTGLIINTDFNGEVIAWDMAGISFYNIYDVNVINLTEKYLGDDAPTSVDYYGGTIIGCSNTGTLKYYYDQNSYTGDAIAYIGGIVGVNRGGKIGRCYSIMETDINVRTHTTSYIGGLIGSNNVNDIADAIYPVVEHSYAIVNCNITNSGNRGAIVGVYGSTMGTNINYSSKNFCLENISYVSQNYGPVGGTSLSITINKVNTIATSATKTTLNTVNAGDTTYSHSREFAISGGRLILTTDKLIED